MGELSCQRCGAKAEGDTRKEADDLIDHGVGAIRGRPCSGLQSDLKWTDSTRVTKREEPEVEKLETITEGPKKKSKKSKKG